MYDDDLDLPIHPSAGTILFTEEHGLLREMPEPNPPLAWDARGEAPTSAIVAPGRIVGALPDRREERSAA